MSGKQFIIFLIMVRYERCGILRTISTTSVLSLFTYCARLLSPLLWRVSSVTMGTETFCKCWTELLAKSYFNSMSVLLLQCTCAFLYSHFFCIPLWNFPCTMRYYEWSSRRLGSKKRVLRLTFASALKIWKNVPESSSPQQAFRSWLSDLAASIVFGGFQRLPVRCTSTRPST